MPRLQLVSGSCCSVVACRRLNLYTHTPALPHPLATHPTFDIQRNANSHVYISITAPAATPRAAVCDCVFWGNKKDSRGGRETCCILCDVRRGEHGFLKLALGIDFRAHFSTSSRLIKSKKRPRPGHLNDLSMTANKGFNNWASWTRPGPPDLQHSRDGGSLHSRFTTRPRPGVGWPINLGHKNTTKWQMNGNGHGARTREKHKKLSTFNGYP